MKIKLVKKGNLGYILANIDVLEDVKLTQFCSVLLNIQLMKNLKLYPTIWQSIPYSLDTLDQWDENGKRIKDLVLSNTYASENGVSQMNLNIEKFSALDTNGTEHFISDFKGNNGIAFEGLHTGLFVKTRSVLSLQPGSYSSFRFYLGNRGNTFTFSDRSSQAIHHLEYLEFTIENGLTLTGNEAEKVILRFDFEPYTLKSYVKQLLQLFKGEKIWKTKWATHS